MPGKETAISQSQLQSRGASRPGRNKVYPSPEEAVADVFDGAVVLVAGFAGCDWPEGLLGGLRASGVSNLTVVCQGVWPGLSQSRPWHRRNRQPGHRGSGSQTGLSRCFLSWTFKRNGGKVERRRPGGRGDPAGSSGRAASCRWRGIRRRFFCQPVSELGSPRAKKYAVSVAATTRLNRRYGRTLLSFGPTPPTPWATWFTGTPNVTGTR